MKPIFADDAAMTMRPIYCGRAAWLRFQPRQFTVWALTPPILMRFGEYFKPKADQPIILSLFTFPVWTALTIGR